MKHVIISKTRLAQLEEQAQTGLRYQGRVDAARLCIERAQRQITLGQPVRAIGLLDKALEYVE